MALPGSRTHVAALVLRFRKTRANMLTSNSDALGNQPHFFSSTNLAEIKGQCRKKNITLVHIHGKHHLIFSVVRVSNHDVTKGWVSQAIPNVPSSRSAPRSPWLILLPFCLLRDGERWPGIPKKSIVLLRCNRGSPRRCVSPPKADPSITAGQKKQFLHSSIEHAAR